MLLDARGHLKLTDLGLCKKVGEVSPTETPEKILESLREELRSGGDTSAMGDLSAGVAGLKTHRPQGDEMAMSIDDSDRTRIEVRDPKMRREVSFVIGVNYIFFNCKFSDLFDFCVVACIFDSWNA